MVEPRRRTDKELVQALGAWLVEARAWFGWSREELIRQIVQLPQSIRFDRVPVIDEVIALEGGEPKKVPAWTRLARMAVERAGLPGAQHAAWLDRRQWYRPAYAIGDVADMARPWVLRDEFLHLERLSSMNDENRASVFRFAREIEAGGG